MVNDMVDGFEKWLNDARKLQGSMQNEAARREAQNEAARAKQQKLDGPKEYEKAQQTQAAKSAKLRELRLAKEALEREEAAKPKAPPAKRARSVTRKDHAEP